MPPVTNAPPGKAGPPRFVLPIPVIALAIAGGLLIFAGTATTLAAQEDPYLKCADIKKSKKRLRCYDSVLRELHPELVEKIEEATREEQREEFGSPEARTTDEEIEKIDQLDVVIVEYGKNPYGKWLLVTEGGQIWKQVDDLRLNLRGNTIKGRIKRGLFGSFFFLPEGKDYGIKVKRLR